MRKKSMLPYGIKILLLLNLSALMGCFFYGVNRYLAFVKEVDIPGSDVLIPVEYTSSIYNAKTQQETRKLQGDVEREFVPIEKIPVSLQQAVIAIEDRRFYKHKGVDLKASARALYANMKDKGISEGGSTITQQLIKLNVLKDSSVHMERKLKEQFLAYRMEENLVVEKGNVYEAKQFILENYLNSVNFGHGVYGAGAAAKYYFNKDVWELNLSECTTLAAIIKNPTKFSPKTDYEENVKRKKLVLSAMLEEGYMMRDDYNACYYDNLSEIIQQNINERPAREVYTYYEDALIQQVKEDLMEQKNMTEEEANKMIYQGGLKIYAAVDDDVQSVLDNAFNNPSLFPKQSKQEDGIVQPQAAMVIVDYQKGEVAAICGGRGEKTVDRSFNRATQAKRQPGSVFKVLAAYAPALDTNTITPEEKLIDAPFTIYNYTPKNWNGRYIGATSVRTAIQNSMNVLAVKTLAETGYDTAFDYLLRFGFTTLVDQREENGKIFTDKGPALALGGITDGVTLLELTNAYGVIAHKGKFNRASFYTKVLDRNGNILLENNLINRPVLKEETALILTDFCKSVVERGTGTVARFRRIRMPIAGKTGTTTNTKDLLFVGYTPYYAAGVWLGHDQPKDLNESTIHMTLWRHVMEEIHQNKEIKQFETIKIKEYSGGSGSAPVNENPENPETREIITDNAEETANNIEATETTPETSETTEGGELVENAAEGEETPEEAPVEDEIQSEDTTTTAPVESDFTEPEKIDIKRDEPIFDSPIMP